MIELLFILIRAQLASHDSVTSQLQKERDLAQDELDNMNSVLEQETASLKFQLSTIQMELAQERKVRINQHSPCLEVAYKQNYVITGRGS